MLLATCDEGPRGGSNDIIFNSCLGMFGEIVGARLLACWSFCWF